MLYCHGSNIHTMTNGVEAEANILLYMFAWFQLMKHKCRAEPSTAEFNEKNNTPNDIMSIIHALMKFPIVPDFNIRSAA